MKKSFGFIAALCALILPACDDIGNHRVEFCHDDICETDASCGNGVCDGDEDYATCPDDCEAPGSCGNGTCDEGESESSCPADCHATSSCGNGTCDNGETEASCPADCTTTSSCGNGTCDEGESEASCQADCHAVSTCGNGSCDNDETETSCPEDCQTTSSCGNGTCDDGETEASCPEDCEATSSCGNGTCDEGEDFATCPDDCVQTSFEPLTMDEFSSLKEVNARFMFDYERIGQPTSGGSETEELAQILSDFFAFPYPSEVRTDEYGRADLANFRVHTSALIKSLLGTYVPTLNLDDIFSDVIKLVQAERAGFSTIGGIYFRTSQPLDSPELPDVLQTARPDSCFQLINVEPGSLHYRERYPVYVTYHQDADYLWADNTVVIRPVPGVNPEPGSRHVAIIGNCLTSDGKPLQTSKKLQYIMHKAAPEELSEPLEFYVDQIEAMAKDGELGMELDDIRAFSGYQTMNPADELDQIAADLKGKGSVVTNDNGTCVGKYQTNSNDYIFTGTFNTVSYMEGKYPYSGDGDGAIRFDTDGKLVTEGKPETVEFKIIIPKTAMPEKGYPIAVYGHGTGGDSDTHITEGRAIISAGVPMAMLGFDAVMHGKRVLDENGIAYPSSSLIDMVSKNAVAIRESWRQTVVDMLVLYDLLESGKIVLPPVPGGTENVIFDNSFGMYMGHSQGSQEGGMLLGLTGLIHNAFLSAGGGGVMYAFVERTAWDIVKSLDIDATIKMLIGNNTIADLLGMILDVHQGKLSYDAFVTTQIVQPLLEPIDPLIFTPRFIKEPPAGMTPKNIVQTIGIGDSDTPNSLQFAMISSIGLPPVGDLFKVSDPMKIVGFDTPLDAPVSGNIATKSGTVTGGSLQFEVTGCDGHFAIYCNQNAKQAYINFFDSVLKGTPTISVSAD